ncbi:gamma-tubulin complex component 2 [Iris pallida]|uniref:Gamma-tubulin complex component n=1 Tax=Iris pallida TaxID=29817 RepID=A0AAX6HRZ4_IRIPA|nr:gamma-tubulin complex component 2 [Iris pallida]
MGAGGIEGRYISIKKVRGKESHIFLHIDLSMDLALQELVQRIFPLCEDFVLISQFVESESHFKSGLVNHAFAVALRALLLSTISSLREVSVREPPKSIRTLESKLKETMSIQITHSNSCK